MKRTTRIVDYLSYLYFFITAVLLAFFYQHTFFILVVLLEICLPFFSYFSTRYCFARLTPYLAEKPGSTTKNQLVQLTAGIQNPTRLPVSAAEIHISFSSLFYNTTEEKTHRFFLKAGNDNALTFPVQLQKCGLYEAKISELVVYDYLHLFRFQKSMTLTGQIRVFPDTVPSGDPHEAIYSEGFDEFEESARSGSVSSNVTDIREYIPGDRLQKIHWKLSSKVDKLMVKENESTSTNEFLLLMELFQPKEDACKDNPGLCMALDETLDTAWALALELMDAGEIFSFSFYSLPREDFVMSTIRCREDLENAFCECYYAPSYDTENLALDIYERSGMKKGTVLHVTHKGVIDVPSSF